MEFRPPVAMADLARPGWLKRRLLWPVKAKVLRSLAFKVALVATGAARYWGDVGWDLHSAIQWANMRGCYR